MTIVRIEIDEVVLPMEGQKSHFPTIPANAWWHTYTLGPWPREKLPKLFPVRGQGVIPDKVLP